MTYDEKTENTESTENENTPPPAVTNICSSFQAEMGAQVTFNNAQNGTTITPIASHPWPFCHQDGSDYPTITFPISSTANTVYLKSSGISVGHTYNYDVSQQCPPGVTKGVTIIANARLKKTA